MEKSLANIGEFAEMNCSVPWIIINYILRSERMELVSLLTDVLSTRVSRCVSNKREEKEMWWNYIEYSMS